MEIDHECSKIKSKDMMQAWGKCKAVLLSFGERSIEGGKSDLILKDK